MFLKKKWKYVCIMFSDSFKKKEKIPQTYLCMFHYQKHLKISGKNNSFHKSTAFDHCTYASLGISLEFQKIVKYTYEKNNLSQTNEMVVYTRSPSRCQSVAVLQKK